MDLEEQLELIIEDDSNRQELYDVLSEMESSAVDVFIEVAALVVEIIEAVVYSDIDKEEASELLEETLECEKMECYPLDSQLKTQLYGYRSVIMATLLESMLGEIND